MIMIMFTRHWREALAACLLVVGEEMPMAQTPNVKDTAWVLSSLPLQLIGDDRVVLATLAQQPATLAGTAWLVTGYNNGKQGVVSVLAETTLTMNFGADGRVSGSAGCNTYTGAYTSQDGALKFGAAAATRKMCVRPERVMEQEQQFLKALEMVVTTRFESDRLELRTAEGALAISLRRDLR
jgi:heat shock protein HslJ